MKMFFITATLLCFYANYAQQTLTLKDGKKFSATEVWEFLSEAYIYDHSPKIQVARTSTGGLIKISIKVSQEKLYVGERIFINLKNNQVIYCTDKGNREYKDGVASTIFMLTANEMQLLQNQDIADIRFKILGVRKMFDSKTGFFTASNILTVFDSFTPDKKSIDTKSAIRNLLK